MVKKIVKFFIPGVAALLLPACNGIFSDIYDSPESQQMSTYGFIVNSTSTEPGTIYIDATDYRRWTYIDFHTLSIDTLDIDYPEPAAWDIAIHRYDAKTNGGVVAETGATSFTSPVITPGEFVADTWTTETIITDMSTMMDGYLSYKESDYNPELSKWLNVDKSSMPPVYTPSSKVYIARLADGSHVALRLDNYMDASGVKGYMTISYIYPYNL
ncbi:MAG: HmuY family protein [Muribaculaceae bacterium]|nr:HmuY family protein [Muribaculaceae bacterium]